MIIFCAGDFIFLKQYILSLLPKGLIISTFLFLCISNTFVYAQQAGKGLQIDPNKVNKKTGKKVSNKQMKKVQKVKLYNRIVIHNFKTLSKQNKYKYYATIIPYTIAKNLNLSKKYVIFNIPAKLRTLVFSGLKVNSKEYKRKVELIKNKVRKVDFIITGSSNVEVIKEKDKPPYRFLVLKVQIYNIKKQKTVTITKRSKEVGAFLKDTIDELSGSLSQQIAAFQVENRKKPVVKKKKEAFTGFYGAISNTSFGVDVGNFFVRGDYNNYYKDGEYIHSYLLFNTSGIFGVSLNSDYFITDNADNYADAEDADDQRKREMTVITAGLGLHLSLPFSKYMWMSLAVQGGGAQTEIREYKINGSSNNDYVTKESYDFYADASAYVNINFAPLQVRFGGSYKRFFTSTTLELYCFFVGAAYKL